MGLWWRNIGALGAITEVIVAIIKSKMGMVLVEVPRARKSPIPVPIPSRFCPGGPTGIPDLQNRGVSSQIPDFEAAQKTNVDTRVILIYAKGPKPPL